MMKHNNLFFFFDIDNTLIEWPTGIISDSTQYALDQLRLEGHNVAIATGRLQLDARHYAALAGIDDFVADGGYSVTINNQLISMESMDIEICKKLLSQLTERNMPWAVVTENKMKRYTPYSHLTRTRAPWDHFKTVHVPTLDYKDLSTIYKIYIYPENQYGELRTIDFGGLEYLSYGEAGMLIEPMDKAYGIRKMANHYNIPYDHIVTFGDGNNDIGMFAPEWTNIAMGNARPKLKALADYVTDDCNKDGILKACLHFGWIKE